MKEATERKIDLKDWDSDTVSQMVQFLYTGDYQYPDPILISPAPEEADGRAKPRPKGSVPESLRGNEPIFPPDKFLLGLPPAPKRHLSDTERFCGSKGAKFDYGDALLSHASIYALARYKSIPALQHLSFHRLWLILSMMEPIEPGSHAGLNLVDLVRFTYTNTARPIDSKEPLRELISEFIADFFPRWQAEPAAVELMCEGGDFVRDVMAAMSRKIADDVKSPRVIPSQVLEPQVSSTTVFISKLNVVTPVGSR